MDPGHAPERMEREVVVLDMNEVDLKSLIESIATSVIEAEGLLTALDQAIGDGDHGANMKRGFEAVLADSSSLAAKPLPEALKGVGTHLVMKVGGASGPLYGTLFLALGKELSPDPSLTDLHHALLAAVAAVKARGKSDVGQKTLLDVFAPVLQTLATGGTDLPRRLVDAANEAAAATVPMKAIRGRASFLGDRSIGHMDPGACSAALMINAAVKAVEGWAK